MALSPASSPSIGAFRCVSVLKQDLFGRVERGVLNTGAGDQDAVRRDLRAAPWILRPLARKLAAREARALQTTQGIPRVPELLSWQKDQLIRTWIPGRTLQESGNPGPSWFEEARLLLDELHARGVTHNDLHKEPNLLVDPQGHPALVDFQLASIFGRRGSWYRMYVREDVRHLLKHKRTYQRNLLTPEEKIILARKSWIARWWQLTGKKVYRLVTRRLLNWRDREGAPR